MYGPRGWTVEAGVWEVLRQARDELRSTVIPARYGCGPRGEVVDGRPVDDYVPYHDLGPEQARRLLEVIPAQALDDRQNLGPTLGTMLRVCVRANGRVRLSGYAIGPQRPDERVSVEGMWIADPDLLDFNLEEVHSARCQCRDAWAAVRQRYDVDAHAVPDEISLMPRLWTRGEPGLWLWWD